jgi:hypothetical protein
MPNTGEVSPDQLLGSIDKLMNAALATSTKITYKRAWDQFNVFSLAILGKVMIPHLTVNYFFVYFLFVSQQICSNYNINIFICYRICRYNVALC